MNKEGAGRPSLARLLDEVLAWEGRSTQEIGDALTLLGAEEDAARRLQAEGARRLAALGAIRREQMAEQARVAAEAVRRRRVSVAKALEGDRGTVLARASEPSSGLPPAATGIGILVSAEPATGPTEALVVVLPVPFSVYEDGTMRTEDLATWLAYRVVAGVHALLVGVGCAEAPVRFAELHGCLAIQVWLGDAGVQEELRELVLHQVAASVERAPELEAAGLEVYTVWLTPELLAEASA